MMVMMTTTSYRSSDVCEEVQRFQEALYYRLLLYTLISASQHRRNNVVGTLGKKVPVPRHLVGRKHRHIQQIDIGARAIEKLN
jgi:hypothetical protein